MDMGCSAGIIAVGIARALLQLRARINKRKGPNIRVNTGFHTPTWTAWAAPPATSPSASHATAAAGMAQELEDLDLEHNYN